VSGEYRGYRRWLGGRHKPSTDRPAGLLAGLLVLGRYAIWAAVLFVLVTGVLLLLGNL
jgi:hypothetical protein